MRPRFSLSTITLLLGVLTAAAGAAAEPIRVIVHPSRAGALSHAEVRAIFLKQKVLWGDGQTIVPINREAGSPLRERFSTRLLGQGSQRLVGYWNQRYFEAGEFPPATLASQDAVLAFVAANPNAVGYVAASSVSDAVAVALEIDD
jgi:ABC-type phosphate transport system substrate-binding protein